MTDFEFRKKEFLQKKALERVKGESFILFFLSTSIFVISLFVNTDLAHLLMIFSGVLLVLLLANFWSTKKLFKKSIPIKN